MYLVCVCTLGLPIVDQGYCTAEQGSLCVVLGVLALRYIVLPHTVFYQGTDPTNQQIGITLMYPGDLNQLVVVGLLFGVFIIIGLANRKNVQ